MTMTSLLDLNLGIYKQLIKVKEKRGHELYVTLPAGGEWEPLPTFNVLVNSVENINTTK